MCMEHVVNAIEHLKEVSVFTKMLNFAVKSCVFDELTLEEVVTDVLHASKCCVCEHAPHVSTNFNLKVNVVSDALLKSV